MIWWDIKTKKPIAPGSCEGGGNPSISHRWCPSCLTERALRYEDGMGRCEVCYEPILMQA
jgi:hypothetical protein